MRRGVVACSAFLAVLAPPALSQDLDRHVSAATFKSDAEYRKNWANDAVNADEAHKRGWTGAGRTVAIFDTGLKNHAEFKGRIVTGFDAVAGSGGVSGDPNGHGTFVTGVVGAARNGKGMEGIAYKSKLMPIRIANADGSVTLADANLAAGIRFATGKAAVFNNSWNAYSTLAEVSRLGFESYYLQSLPAWRDAVAADTVVVWAAGNSGRSDPGAFGALPSWYGDLQKGWVTAVATDKSGAIAGYSNRCGASAAWCLAAPGSELKSTKGTKNYGTGSGTSFAAPVVAGGALLLKQQWPHLSGDQITGILFRTANKTGIYADAATYGQGLLDLDAATRPVGATGIATGGTTATTVPASGSMLVSSTAFGQGIQIASAGATVMVLDEYGRDFQAPLDAFVVAAATSYDLERGLARLGDGLHRLDAGNGLSLSVADGGAMTAAGLPRHVLRLATADGGSLTTMAGVSPVHLFGGIAADLDAAGMLASSEAAGSAYLGLAGDEAVAAEWTVPVGRFDVGFAAFHGRPDDPLEGPEYAAMNIAREDRGPSVAGLLVRGTTGIGGAMLGLHSGLVRENGTVLGSAADGAFALGESADTLFAGLSLDAPLGGGFSAFAGAEIGRTDADAAAGSLVSGLSGVTTTAFHLGIARAGLFGDADRLAFVASQPLRADGGRATLRLPTAREIDGTVHYAESSHEVAADGRELDLQLGYSLPLGEGESVTAAGLLRLQPDNVRTAAAEKVFMIKYRLEF